MPERFPRRCVVLRNKRATASSHDTENMHRPDYTGWFLWLFYAVAGLGLVYTVAAIIHH